MIEFSVVDWAAWAPGLATRSAWQDWAQAPWLPEGEDTPGLPEVPAMQRRRIERLGRMAIQAACWCEAGEGADSRVPLVFASRHGDVARSMDLLGSLVADQPLSPTGFGLSVHNAIAALYSIVRGERGNYLALAAGRATAITASRNDTEQMCPVTFIPRLCASSMTTFNSSARMVVYALSQVAPSSPQ